MLEFIATFIVSYLWHGMGTTIGYHRLLAHRSFKCSKPVEYFWVTGGYLAFEGSPIWWTSIHRAHHRYTDSVLDPHSPRYGIKNAYCGWTQRKTYPEYIHPQNQCPDLVSDPVYRFLDQDANWTRAAVLTTTTGILFRAGLWVLFGWKVALASALAGIVVLQIPLLLNVVCHIPRLGYKNYARDDDSVNIWWVALIAYGEGWHNNHHEYPGSARSGLKRHEFDLSWETIKLSHALGLVDSMNEAKPSLEIAGTFKLSRDSLKFPAVTTDTDAMRSFGTDNLPGQKELLD